MRRLVSLLASAALLLAACQSAAPLAPRVAPSIAPTEAAPAQAAPQTAAVIPTLSPRSATSTPTAAAVPPAEVVAPTPAAVQPTAVETMACSPDLCSYAGALFLSRPVLAPGNDEPDATYRFGSTQSGMRDPHHGVEFLNAYGTPVVAAGDGVVVAAGTDMDPTSPRGVWPVTYYGPYSNFYGNLVVIEHPAPQISPAPQAGLPLPVYTLYGHLSAVEVQVGQTVTAGQEIGKVGQAGIATGPHLHFEVRLGENTYQAAHNPELWLGPGVQEGGEARGAIAGRFLDSYQNYEHIDSIVIEHMPDGPQGAAGEQASVMTYEEAVLSGQYPWQESFGAGDLKPGWYRLSFPMGGLRQEMVQVLPGQVTVVTFRR